VENYFILTFDLRELDFVKHAVYKLSSSILLYLGLSWIL